MATRAKAKAHKGVNGTGSSVTVFFDTTDPAERKALEAARLLAAKHGRRKQAIIALLEAVYDHYEDSGTLMTTSEITAALMGQPILQARAPVDFAPQQIALDVSAEQRRASRQYDDDTPRVVVAEGRKTSAETVAKNFLKGMSDAFFD